MQYDIKIPIASNVSEVFKSAYFILFTVQWSKLALPFNIKAPSQDIFSPPPNTKTALAD